MINGGIKVREMSFRGKRFDGVWAYGYYSFQRKPTGIRGQQVSEHDYDRHLIASARFGSYWDVAPETVGQYTGTLDKNGKKIFETDKVIVTNINGEPPFEGNVFYNSSHCGFLIDGKGSFIRLGDVCSLFIEVVGNIHDIETK